MLERFDETSVKVLSSARDASFKLGHNFIGTEMILIGFVSTGGIAPKTLASLNLD